MTGNMYPFSCSNDLPFYVHFGLQHVHVKEAFPDMYCFPIFPHKFPRTNLKHIITLAKVKKSKTPC